MLENKVRAVQSLTLGEVSQVMEKLGRPSPAAPPPAPKTGTAAPKAVPVEVVEPPLSPFSLAERVLASVVSPPATIGITFLVAIFVLMQQYDLRDRLIQLFGSSDLHRTTLAMDGASVVAP